MTSLALLDVIENCYKMIDDNNYVIALYFDLQKAFDSCDHAILLDKLYHYGIRGSIHKWFFSLENRTQYTYVNGASSRLG